MSKIKVTTITPVHVGSGRTLQDKVEFLKFTGENKLALVDEKKVLEIIGKENIPQWINIIEKHEDLKEYLLQRKSNLQPGDIASRLIDIRYSQGNHAGTLKEQLHNGSGWPIIPGSSLKGSIRTAFFTYVLKKSMGRGMSEDSLKDKWGNFKDQKITRKIFGENPNKDFFRAVKISDLHFQSDTEAHLAKILNYGRGDWIFKHGTDQLLETIGEGCSAEGDLSVNTWLLKQRELHNPVGTFDETELLKIVNEHTKALLDDEIGFWEEEPGSEQTLDMVDLLKEINKKCHQCGKGEAIARLGLGSGWMHMTGNWAKDEDLVEDDLYYSIVKACRRKDYPDDVPFPKTRKVTDETALFGFIKISLV